MHAFALPGLSQMSCENDTSTPGFIILHRPRLVVCLQLAEHNVGCCVGRCGCGGYVLFLVCSSLSHSLGDPCLLEGTVLEGSWKSMIGWGRG